MRPKELSFGLGIVIFPPLKTEKGRETSAFSSLNWADKSPYTHQKPEDSSMTIIFLYLPEISTGCCRNTLPGRRKQDVMRRCKVGTSRERERLTASSCGLRHTLTFVLSIPSLPANHPRLPHFQSQADVPV